MNARKKAIKQTKSQQVISLDTLQTSNPIIIPPINGPTIQTTRTKTEQII